MIRFELVPEFVGETFCEFETSSDLAAESDFLRLGCGNELARERARGLGRGTGKIGGATVTGFRGKTLLEESGGVFTFS